MGTRAAGSRRPRPLSVLLALVAVLAVVGLSGWWWLLRTSNDPVSADLVAADGSIVTSDPCTVPAAASTVEFGTPTGSVTASLSVCGYQPQQRIVVEYLRSDSGQVRAAGTSTAEPSVLRRLLPIGILFFGLVAAGALVTLARDQRRAEQAVASTPSWTRVPADGEGEGSAGAPAPPPGGGPRG